MDAVRQFIQDCGGEITVELYPSPGASEGCCPFQFRITLPFDLFEEPFHPEDKKAA
ncbi:MAG: hypothetical protein M3Q07_25655 [Pseudobdellovibrionaceae bacterium]|nr:hypothetical protein [Pseudobdellovibrionaceae bacterium]